MRVSLRRLLFSGGLLVLAACVAPIIETTYGSAQDAPSVGLDADPADNTAVSLGPIDSCVSVKKGDTFQVDIYVADIVNLLAWEIYFRYDPSVVTIADRDVQMFLAGNTGSEVFDASEALPEGGELYRLAAIDLAIPHAPDSGSGVLTRLTLQALASGVSPADIATVDLNADGKIDVGPMLTDERGNPIGPSGPEGFFAGPIANATIAVDSPCEPTTPVPTTPSPAESPTPAASPAPALTSSPTATTPATAFPPSTPAVTRTTTPTTAASSTPTPAVTGSDDGSLLWVIALVLAGLVGVLAVGAGATLFIRARHAG